MSWRWGEDRYYAEDLSDTGLQFTDVLFGFALSEIVLRLVKWTQLTNAARMHLGLAAITILGSYIGFRNSQKRGRFRLRFFNLVTLRFLFDQTMVFFYFWLALYIPLDEDKTTGTLTRIPDARDLLRFDARVVFGIFALYLGWDLISQWMAASGKYFTQKATAGPPPTSEVRLEAKGYRTMTTGFGVAAALAVLIFTHSKEPADAEAMAGIIGLISIMVGYRMVKDGWQVP